MADRSLRGTGLGAKSFEDEAGVEFAARQEVGYDCPREHHFSLVFAAEADIPSVWECPRCGAESLRSDGERPELKEEKPARTHWDMLRERRSIAELEDLLAERLSLLRSGKPRPQLLSRRQPVQEDRVPSAELKYPHRWWHSERCHERIVTDPDAIHPIGSRDLPHHR